MSERVVAVKAKNTFYGAVYLIFIAVLAFCAFAGCLIAILLLPGADLYCFIIIAVSGIVCVFAIVCGVKLFRRYKNTPDILITYRDGMFVFADGATCRPDEITCVTVKADYRRTNRNIQPHKIEIVVNGTKKYDYTVANAEDVNRDIQSIKNIYYADRESAKLGGATNKF